MFFRILTFTLAVVVKTFLKDLPMIEALQQTSDDEE